MRDKLGIALILLLAFFAILPPMFSKGGTLDVLQIYYDNIFFTLLYFILSYISIVLPFLLPKIKRTWAHISSMIGAWFFASFLYEMFNFAIPDVVLNNSEDRTLFTKFLICFSLGVSIIMVRETWQKSEK